MKPESVVIVGAGGHAKVVIELVRAEGKYEILGCTDLNGDDYVLGNVPILGTDAVLPSLFMQGVKKAFVAVGDNHLRQCLLTHLLKIGFELANAVSPNAVISTSARLGCGIAIMAGSVINASAQIGDGAIINTNAGVDHDCRIGDYAHIGPAAALAGNVEVGLGSFIGIGASILPGVRIGDRVIVGAGSVVIRDIPNDVTAFGVPARVVHDLKTPALNHGRNLRQNE
jgi:UDP-perosamine 4-acetyltransferase